MGTIALIGLCAVVGVGAFVWQFCAGMDKDLEGY